MRKIILIVLAGIVLGGFFWVRVRHPHVFVQKEKGFCLIHFKSLERHHWKVAALRNGRRECIDSITFDCPKCEGLPNQLLQPTPARAAGAAER